MIKITTCEHCRRPWWYWSWLLIALAHLTVCVPVGVWLCSLVGPDRMIEDLRFLVDLGGAVMAYPLFVWVFCKLCHAVAALLFS